MDHGDLVAIEHHLLPIIDGRIDVRLRAHEAEQQRNVEGLRATIAAVSTAIADLPAVRVTLAHLGQRADEQRESMERALQALATIERVQLQRKTVERAAMWVFGAVSALAMFLASAAQIYQAVADTRVMIGQTVLDGKR